METIKIKNKSFSYVTDFRDDTRLRTAFNTLTQAVYGFDFNNWFDSGYWGNNYKSHALMDGEKMISNVSVSEIEFIVNGVKQKYIQIGTVMTLPNYRNLGLNKALLEIVLAAWRGKCDMIYLFANDTVLEFYPKFGFKPVQEFQYSKSLNGIEASSRLRQLNMSSLHSRSLVADIASNAVALSSLTMHDNVSLIMFWLTSFYSDYVYYWEEHNAVIVMRRENSVVYLVDVFCDHQLELDKVIEVVVSPSDTKLVLGFTPLNKSDFAEQKLEPDDVLFVLDDNNGLSNERFMFPLLSHA